jgi:hypothetical protein
MLLSTLIAILQHLQREHGDIQTRWDSMSHSFPPDPIVRSRPFLNPETGKIEDRKVVILNS